MPDSSYRSRWVINLLNSNYLTVNSGGNRMSDTSIFEVSPEVTLRSASFRSKHVCSHAFLHTHMNIQGVSSNRRVFKQL